MQKSALAGPGSYGCCVAEGGSESAYIRVVKEKLTDAGNEARDQENIRRENRKVGEVGSPNTPFIASCNLAVVPSCANVLQVCKILLTQSFDGDQFRIFINVNYDDDDDEKDEVNDRDRMDGGGRGAEVARNNDGGGAWEDGGEVDGPRGKGMQDIAAPRDTRGRNLHDGAGDVLQSSSPPTTKSLVAPMYEWPILLGLSLGKSIYSDYRFFSCISLVLSPFPMDSGLPSA
ncbi:hypothetical protein EAG_16215 [Camponotus floridanus]|uniref:Uncharacterized protein n=1 Tax=Camponotus floridanus TaxID=104421 RepID=E2AG43_CAMFO|nr:hypothetical protein EAG_16215 [Camponotus floridanus]